MSQPIDISATIVAKSDQLNADDLHGGPIIVRIENVRVVGGDQPVIVDISGGHRPWKPSKTALRMLAACAGTDAARWIGRWVSLYNDPTVKWGGAAVGGIRMSAMSGLTRDVTVSLAVTRGKKKPWTIKPLTPPAEPLDLDAVLADLQIDPAQFTAWLASKSQPALADMTPAKRAKWAGWLTVPENTDKVQAFTTEPAGDSA